MNFGKALKTIRLIRGLSQTEAAALANMDPRTLREIESGRTTVSVDLAVRFSSIYEVDINTIYDLASDKTSLNQIVQTLKHEVNVHENAQQTPDTPKILKILQEIAEKLKKIGEKTGE